MWLLSLQKIFATKSVQILKSFEDCINEIDPNFISKISSGARELNFYIAKTNPVILECQIKFNIVALAHFPWLMCGMQFSDNDNLEMVRC